MMREMITRNRWDLPDEPKRILAIRLQAMGDAVITLPYLQGLRNRLPAAQLDFLTREEVADIPRSIELFDRIFVISGERNYKKMLLSAFALLPKLLQQKYDVVIDLQNNPLSRMIRKVLIPRSWSEFDRLSPISAGERTRATIEAVGFNGITIVPLKLKDKSIGIDLLRANGWQPGNKLIALNPAGYVPTRNWPLNYYVNFADLCLSYYGREIQFIVLGTELVRERAHHLAEQLNPRLINLVSKTTAAEAFSILRRAELILTEDSGLMHIAWTAGVPTLALFGSSRSDWSAPQGKHSLCLNSADLPCGQCMEANCRYADVHCLTRYTPEMVFKTALNLLESTKRGELSQ